MRRCRRSHALAATVVGLVIAVFAPTVFAQVTTVTFDAPTPPGGSGAQINGVYQGIDFGSNRWRWEGAYGPDPTNHVYFNSASGTSRTFTFSVGPRVLTSIRVFTTAAGTLTLSDNLGQTRTQTITVGTMQLVTMGWTQPSTTVTVNFTAGWDLGVDDIAYASAGPADTTAPTVSMTGPAVGASVSNTITVSATASDTGGVAGVQFLLDGVLLGAEDSTAPYAISWDTTTAANGAHTLSARARDAAGNSATATNITVTVANTAPPGTGDLGQWAGPFTWPLAPVHMALLRTGRVLLFDEARGGQSAQVWDPATNVFSAVPLSDNIFCAGHAMLADGTLLVNGGTASGNFYGIPDTNLFNPATQTWTAAAPSSFARWYPTTTTLSDGRILTVSGQVVPGVTADIPEVYDPLTNAWTQLSGAQLKLPLYPLMFLLPDGRVLSAGAEFAPISTRILDVATQAWTTVDANLVDGSSAVMYRPNLFMKSGTQGDVDSPPVPVVATTSVLDLTQPAPAWRQTAPMALPRAYHNLTILADGTVLVTGGEHTANDGRTVSQAVYAAELWNPATQTWTTMASMRRPRLYHSTALLLPDGRVLSAGGYYPPYAEPNAEIYSPPYLFKGPRPTITSAPTVVQQGATFFVGTPDAADIAMASLVRAGDVTHQVNMDQRFLPLTFQRSAGGLVVQAPPDANQAPPGYYMLFLVNTAGVPSIASFVAVPPGGSRRSALRFRGQGVNDGDRVKIRIDDPSSPFSAPPANVGATDFTLEFWMRGTAADNPAPAVPCGANDNWILGNIVIDRDRYNQDRKFGLSIAGGRAVWGVTGSGLTNALTICGATPILDDQWHHIAVQHRVSDGQMSLFVDGQLDAQALGPVGDVSFPYHATPLSLCGPSGNQPCTNSDPFLVIGAEKHDAGSQYPSFNGSVAELRLSNMLRYQNAFAPPTAPFAPDADTVGLYHFDEGTGDVIRDSSGALGGPSPGLRKAGGGASPGAQWTTSTLFTGNPAPTTTSLSPTSAPAGGAAFTLTVNGSSFVSGATVRWNGASRPTTFSSPTRLTAAIAMSDIATAGTATVTVFNPAPGGGVSNAQTFMITAAANPVPTTTSLSPTSAAAGGAAFTLTVDGSSFASGATVRWNGANRPTTFSSPTRLTAAIAMSDIATAGTATVTVFNPAPGGGVSNAQTFTIAAAANPVPTTTSLSPTAAAAGAAAFTLTVNGTGFVSGATVRWNGANRSTTLGSASLLTAAIPASDIAVAGTASVTVVNPAPGGGTSNALTFTITAGGAGATTTVTFDNPIPAGASGSFLNGLLQGINFGSGQWRWETAYGADATRHVYFDSGTGASRTFSFSPAPRTLVSMQVFTGVAGTLTLTDNLGQSRTQSIATGSMQLVTTGWTQASTTVTVSFTAGWELGVDDIMYRSP
jgi:Domain of unknown function (DUF1929)/Bacterial Ig domain